MSPRLQPNSRLEVSVFDARQQLMKYLKADSLTLDPITIASIVETYGGVPVCQRFQTPMGARYIGRYLNFLHSSEVPSPYMPSWRVRDSDARLDYSVPYLDVFIDQPRDRKDYLIPIAGVDTAGINCRELASINSLLCVTQIGNVILWDVGECISLTASLAEFYAGLEFCELYPSVQAGDSRFTNLY